MLYEAAAYVLVFCVLYGAYWKTRIIEFRGELFGITLTSCFLARFLIEFVKEDQVPFEARLPLNMASF
jgi:phosphatidylglycerol---prolipoprotein diacylglyceryl transferase